MKRKATARWQGTGKEGAGTLSTQSGMLNDTPYSFIARFGDGKGTNPEELIAAAHAGCFTMALSFMLNNAGFTAERSTPRRADDGPGRRQAGRSPAIHLTTRARVPEHRRREIRRDRGRRQGQLSVVSRALHRRSRSRSTPRWSAEADVA